MTTKSRRRLRRRLSAAVLLLIGLGVAGGLAATLTPTPQVAVADESTSALLRTGKQLFDTSCVTCHGANLQGVTDRGPSLIGVGDAAVYFQVSTGRMPAMRGEAQAPQKPPQFDAAQIDALGAYVQANGGGPTVPRDQNGKVAPSVLPRARAVTASSARIHSRDQPSEVAANTIVRPSGEIAIDTRSVVGSVVMSTRISGGAV